MSPVLNLLAFGEPHFGAAPLVPRTRKIWHWLGNVEDTYLDTITKAMWHQERQLSSMHVDCTY
eukprot:1430825-Karenia_brevis.AAC.1